MMYDTPPKVTLESLSHEVQELRADMKEMREEVRDLVAAWNTATGLLKFVKWAAGLFAAIATAWVAAKNIWP